jgi:CheY-like chemotaxis protein
VSGVVPLRVLVVDDDDVARELLGSLLRAAGHDVLELPSPIGVSRVVQEQQVNVVVIDVFLPGMKGDRLAKLLRGNSRFDHVGVVLVSGDAGVNLEQLAVEVGAEAAVSKKMARSTLCRAVELGARRGARVDMSRG